MEITEELKNGIISYAIYELLHRMREADYENLIDSHPELKELSDEEIVDIILSIAEEF
jgi:hypothetical protein